MSKFESGKQMEGLLDHERLLDALLEHRRLVANLYDPVLQASTMPGVTQAFRSIDDQFGVGRIFEMIYPPDLEDAQLAGALLSTLSLVSLLAIPRDDPIGLLSPLHESDEMALAWLDPKAPPKLSAAILRRQREDLPSIAIEPKLVCPFCDVPITVKAGRFGWDGDREGILEAWFIPTCATCIRHSLRGADDFKDALAHLLRPKVRIIETDERADGVQRNLRLVERDQGERPETSR